ncbi:MULTISPECIES: GNAT family N-acetyltransferase [Chromobacterium]|uniref:GNAT family N-acetyltransferase n=2 Tax=Chromobacterium TaxID=535 RepID=A0ABS3GK54_9NEIS|nr:MULTISPECIES: GNAT family protein [Chromobacterium]AXT45789.1 N-acetyltransferase [Chromobacterium rhizoryzae]MBK0413892.1 GNAT family N-acetyltransferase [Chromobacterium haemolyticum]MBO0415421.1 GNAT family N-acetyltransferase [Chromobacterium haemolyticum]MBO0498682.1 GNAT family N-acetyltransferase [Chromobacterium haemolyticum]MDH0340756.1 GNAT family N-acetyltransferase [Chromobacterium haemolyticum]
MTWRNLKDLTLENERVRLRRIQIGDYAAFERIVFEPAIWEYFVARIQTPDDLGRFVEQAIQDTLNGSRIVFAIIDRRTDRIVGSTAYGNLAEGERRLEIGWSWLCRDARRTGINRAVKFELLKHAFETLECERVEFKTDVLNAGARAGLAGIGATEEGVLRSFNFMPGGRRRDVIYYSVLRQEWERVRAERFPELAAAASR